MSYKRILFMIPTLGRGGAEFNTVRLANFFANRGNKVSVLTLFAEDQLSPMLSSDVDVVCLRSIRMRRSFLMIFRYISKNKPDIIFSNMWPLNLLTMIGVNWRMMNTQVFFVEHINLKSGLAASTISERLLAHVFHRISGYFGCRFIAVSKGVGQDLAKTYGVPSKQIAVIPNPVIQDMPQVSEKKFDAILNIPRQIKLLAVGNLKCQKDYPNLLGAVNILKNKGFNPRVKIAGAGPKLTELQNVVEKLGLTDEVTFLGSVADPTCLYQECDVYVLSSAWEGFGNTIVEALSHGCRVVSTDCESGPSEILDEGKYGTLVDPKNSEALASGIISALSKHYDPITLQARAEHYSVSRIGREYESLFDLKT